MKELTKKRKMLAVAIYLAAKKHMDQFDKGGNPYVLHPLKVMHYTRSTDPELQAISVMHDLIEDCFDSDIVAGAEYLRLNGMSDRIVDGVVALTKLNGETYEDYITRLMKNKDAVIVKLADLRHNTDIRRLKGLSAKDFDRMQRYQTTYVKLQTYAKEQGWMH